MVERAQSTAWSKSGFLEYRDNNYNASSVEQIVSEDTSRILLGETSVNAAKQIGVNWTASLKTGDNNRIKKILKYSFDMVDFKVARFELTDAGSDRFSIPDEFVNRENSNKNMRLDMLGHIFKPTEGRKNDPFNFQFNDNIRPDEVLLSTAGQSLIFTDKYIQMDFLLPSLNVYGFGERISTFKLSQGAWGMWSTGLTDQG